MRRTQFTDIPDKNLNDRMDRVIEEFKAGIDKLRLDTEHLKRRQEHTQNWFSQNLADLIHDSAMTGKIVDVASLIPATPKGDVQRSSAIYHQYHNIQLQFERGVVSQRPGFGVWGWLSGDLKNQKETFLNHLATKGGELMESARSIKAAAESDLEDCINLNLEDYEAASLSYRKLTEYALSGQSDRALEIIGEYNFPSNNALGGLLTKPVGEHASLLLALTAGAETPKDEAVIVSRFIQAVDNDSISLTALSYAMSNASEDKQESYKKYLSAFAGVFIPIQNDVANANMYLNASYENGKLEMLQANGYHSRWAMDEAKARSVIEALAARPNYMIVGADAVNTNMYLNASYEDGKLEMLQANGYHSRWTVDEAEARSVIEALAARPNYMPVGGDAVNTNMYLNASYENGKLEILQANGYHSTWIMDEVEAKVAIDALTERPNYMRVGGDAVNTNMYLNASYENGKLEMLQANGYHSTWIMDEVEAKAVIDALTERPNYMRVGADAVNTNMYLNASYEDGELETLQANGYHSRWEMDEAEARSVIEALVVRPNYMRVGADAVNTNMYLNASYEGGELEMLQANGYHSRWEMDEAEARSVIEALVVRPNYMRVDNDAINIMKYLNASYESGELEMLQANGYHSRWTVDEESLSGILKDMRQMGQKMSIGQMASSSEQMQYALRQSRDWGSSYSSQDNSSDNSLMTMMLIVGAMTLFDSDPAAAAEIDFEAGGGDFGGGGADGDMPNMETPEINTPEIDTNDFSVDFEMPDFDMGGGGMDFGDMGMDSGGMDSGGGTFISCDPRLEHRLGARMKFGPNFI